MNDVELFFRYEVRCDFIKRDDCELRWRTCGYDVDSDFLGGEDVDRCGCGTHGVES